MNRRDFIVGSTGLLAAEALGRPAAARAQQQNLPVIGLLDGVSGRLNSELGRGLRENGFLGGRDFNVEYGYRWPKLEADPMARTAAEFVKRQVALIVAFSNKAASVAKAVTDTIPIIFLADEPVAAGLVNSLERPRGHLTGATGSVSDLTTERIAILRQLVPTARTVVLVTDPTNKPAHDIELREAQAAASALELQLSVIAWSGEHDLEPELAALPGDRNTMLVFGAGYPFRVSPGLLAYLATRYDMPAIHAVREAPDAGGLASFGTRLADGGYLMGVYAARVLKGDKPADLPVRQITRTEFVINRGAAKSLGVQIPRTLIARADDVID